MSPKITDIAHIEEIMTLRFRPALRAGSAHLMTPAELDGFCRNFRADDVSSWPFCR